MMSTLARRPKTASRRLENGPRWPQDAPIRPKTAPRSCQDGSKTAPRQPQDGPGRPQEGSKAAQDGTKTPQDDPTRPQTAPRSSQDVTEMPQDGHKMLQDSLQMPLACKCCPNTAQDDVSHVTLVVPGFLSQARWRNLPQAPGSAAPCRLRRGAWRAELSRQSIWPFQKLPSGASAQPASHPENPPLVAPIASKTAQMA